jgi:hypothetical protein
MKGKWARKVGYYNREGREEKPKVEKEEKKKPKVKRKKKKNYIRNLPKTTQNHEVKKEHHLITCLLKFQDRKEKETVRVWLGFLHLILERTREKD